MIDTAEGPIHGPIDLKTLSHQICAIALWIEARGNKGTHEHELTDAGMSVDALEYPTLCDEILFYAEGRRRGDYHGWYCRRKPHWARKWLDRFATVNPELTRLLIDEEHSKALVDEMILEDKRQRVRLARLEKFALGAFVDYTDLQLEYFYEALTLLEFRYKSRPTAARHNDRLISISFLLGELVRKEAKFIARELWFRRQPDLNKVDPDDLEYLQYRPQREIFTREYRRQVVDQAAEPTLEVDLDELPQQALSEKPISTMTQWELLEAFMQWAGLEDENDPFKADDVNAILRSLRAQFSRAKGQHRAAVDPIITEDNDQE